MLRQKVVFWGSKKAAYRQKIRNFQFCPKVPKKWFFARITPYRPLNRLLLIFDFFDPRGHEPQHRPIGKKSEIWVSSSSRTCFSSSLASSAGLLTRRSFGFKYAELLPFVASIHNKNIGLTSKIWKKIRSLT